VHVTAARRDGLVLAGILVVAAALRLAALPGRGEWDDDQGAQLLTMLRWVRDGQAPDLGPLSSFGTAHHGVAYYWLLAPAAFLTDVDPVAAAATMAVIGVAGVAATWWLGRTVAGPLAGHVAGSLMAISPAAISASTFVWNSNVIGPAAALATAAGWHAWRTRRPWWWVVAAVGAVLMMQSHLMAALVAPPLIGLLLADLLSRSRGVRRQMVAPVLCAVAVVVTGYLPLLLHEARHDFSESRAIVDYLWHDGGRTLPEPTGSWPAGLPVIVWRVLTWPLSGFVQSAPLAGFPALFVVLTAMAIAVLSTSGTARQYSRWAVATTIWAIFALSVVSPSLGVITAGLPNDQYHGWLDPILFATVAVAAAQLWNSATTLGRVTGASITASCVALGLIAMPPPSAPDGGWPSARAAAERIRSDAGDGPIAVTGVAKSGTSLSFPLQRAGTLIVDATSAKYLVVVCDPLFERAIGMPCGGPAETAIAAQVGFPAGGLVDQFTDGPRRVVCVFAR
jgi:4-amino-4-deoxy-L-arabinose transferase-like glycosyltransferase